jgi:hypothetical protein
VIRYLQNLPRAQRGPGAWGLASIGLDSESYNFKLSPAENFVAAPSKLRPFTKDESHLTVPSHLDGNIRDVADKLTSELGIKQWYSIHLMDMCE